MNNVNEQIQSLDSTLRNFYEELQERMVELEKNKDSDINLGRISELQLVTLRVQQIILNCMNYDKVTGENHSHNEDSYFKTLG